MKPSKRWKEVELDNGQFERNFKLWKEQIDLLESQMPRLLETVEHGKWISFSQGTVVQ
jgi:hypothetical protein